jgi:hypothetical protein
MAVSYQIWTWNEDYRMQVWAVEYDDGEIVSGYGPLIQRRCRTKPRCPFRLWRKPLTWEKLTNGARFHFHRENQHGYMRQPTPVTLEDLCTHHCWMCRDAVAEVLTRRAAEFERLC